MNIVPAAGLAGSAAGAPLSQTAGSSAERAATDAAAQRRAADADLKAEEAAGIGQTEEDQEASDRDADGRKLWETGAESAETTEETKDPPRSKDVTGNRGNALDLTG